MTLQYSWDIYNHVWLAGTVAPLWDVVSNICSIQLSSEILITRIHTGRYTDMSWATLQLIGCCPAVTCMQQIHLATRFRTTGHYILSRLHTSIKLLLCVLCLWHPATDIVGFTLVANPILPVKAILYLQLPYTRSSELWNSSHWLFKQLGLTFGLPTQPKRWVWLCSLR